MKIQTFIRAMLAAACLVMVLAAEGLTQADENKLVVALSHPGKPGLLRVNLLHGSIKVTGYNGKEVVLTYTSRESRRHANPEESGGLRRLPISGVGLEAREENNTVTISANSVVKPVDLEVRVPYEFSVKLKTINDGHIVVEDLNGELDVDNLNGSITLRNVSGSASASTLNGNIVAVFKKVTPNMPMAFSNLNGKIDVSLPANARFNAKMKTDNGDVFTDFDLEMDKGGKSASREGDDRGQRIYLDKWVYGKVNGGGAEMLFKNFNGNIYIRKNK